MSEWDDGGGPPPEVALGPILAALPVAVYVTRAADSHILYMNPRAEAMVGATSADLAARAVSGRDLWADVNQRPEMMARLEREGHVEGFASRLRRADGTIVDVLSSIQPVVIEGEMCVIATTYDISELTQAEDALRRSERRLRQIAETIDEGFVLASFRPFRVHYASPAYAEIMGTTMDEVYADEPGLFARIEEEDRPVVKASLTRMRAGLRSDEIEVRVVRNGEMRWIRFRWSVVEDEAPEGIVAAVVEDVTGRHRSDAELPRATSRAEEASAAKSSFLSRVSHELRTPLNVILGFGQLLETDDLGPSQHEALREIMGAGRHLLHLVDEVMEISRAESGQIGAAEEDVAVAPVVRAVLDDLQEVAARHGIEVRHDDSCGGSVRGDPTLLADAVRPLVENAIVHNVPGGTVEVTCEDRPGDRIRISVVDTGPGLTPEDLERVYVPFERTQGAGGAGLGLTLARRLVEAMGGELGARSVPGRGSRFWIDLDRAAARGAQAGRRSGGPARHRRVLYIEDNESNAELATRALGDLPDLDLVIASRGAEGLDLIASTPLDLVLLDLHLPDIGGEEILGRIRSNPATVDLPVVVISADASPEVVERLRESGADDYLTKPVSIPHLVRVVDRRAGDRAVAPDTPASGPSARPTPAPSPRAGADVLDPVVVDDLLALEERSPGTLGEVVDLFVRASGERLDAAEAGLARGDSSAVAAMAHALRGSGANLGAVVLAEACQTLEHLARSGGGDLGPLVTQVAAVRQAFEEAAAQLRERVARHSET